MNYSKEFEDFCANSAELNDTAKGLETRVYVRDKIFMDVAWRAAFNLGKRTIEWKEIKAPCKEELMLINYKNEQEKESKRLIKKGAWLLTFVVLLIVAVEAWILVSYLSH